MRDDSYRPQIRREVDGRTVQVIALIGRVGDPAVALDLVPDQLQCALPDTMRWFRLSVELFQSVFNCRYAEVRRLYCLWPMSRA